MVVVMQEKNSDFPLSLMTGETAVAVVVESWFRL